MSSSATTGFCRVTVVAPDSRIDVALPEDVPLADIYPEVLRLTGQTQVDGTPTGFHLVRRDGTVLDSGLPLAAQQVRDGDLLSLRPFAESLPPAVYDDVADAIASAVEADRRFWSPDLMHTGRLVPVYRLTAGLQSRTVRRVVREAIDAFITGIADPMPRTTRDELKLVDVRFAITQMHYPDSMGALESAKRRLAFDELLPYQVAMLQRRRAFQNSAPAEPTPISASVQQGYVDALPFALTKAQQKALQFGLDARGTTPEEMQARMRADIDKWAAVIEKAGVEKQ